MGGGGGRAMAGRPPTFGGGATFESDAPGGGGTFGGGVFGGVSVFGSDALAAGAGTGAGAGAGVGAETGAPPYPPPAGEAHASSAGYPAKPSKGDPGKHQTAPEPPPQNIMTRVDEHGTVFGPGGSAPSSASEVFDAETRELVRINIKYYPSGCCSQHRGISEEYQHSALEGLKSRGIDDATWTRWTGPNGLGKAQVLREPCCPGTCICLLLLPCWSCMLRG